MSAGIRLTLGPVCFTGFEVPEQVAFGGAQRLAVHELPGGARVVDAMGRQDAQITWSGAFSGPDAADRARVLDALRVAGLPLPLSWDAFFYTVVIAELRAEYSTPWWIPFRLTCTVVQDKAAELVAVVASLATSLAGDLAQAGAFTDVSVATTALGVDGATTPNTAGYAGATGALQQVRGGLDAQVDASGAGLGATDLASVVSSAGTLAQASAARDYVGRAQVNLANAGT